MHYDLIIITSNDIDENLLKNFHYLLIDNAIINDDKSIIFQSQKYTYDYLIIDKLFPNLKTLKEDKHIITNQFFETSIESIFAIGEINNSPLDINSQLKIILEYIQNPC